MVDRLQESQQWHTINWHLGRKEGPATTGTLCGKGSPEYFHLHCLSDRLMPGTHPPSILLILKTAYPIAVASQCSGSMFTEKER